MLLGGFDEIKICVGYKMGDVEVNEMPASAIALENCEPVYVTMPGFPSHSLEEWLGIARKCNSEGIGFTGLPAAAQNYIKKLESILGVKISSVGLGPDRDATVDRGESSKGRSLPGGNKGRLAQLEERLVCNQAAVGSNPTAST